MWDLLQRRQLGAYDKVNGWTFLYSKFIGVSIQKTLLQTTQDYGNQAIRIVVPLKYLNAYISEIISDNWITLKNDEKCFLFHVKSSFCSYQTAFLDN